MKDMLLLSVFDSIWVETFSFIHSDDFPSLVLPVEVEPNQTHHLWHLSRCTSEKCLELKLQFNENTLHWIHQENTYTNWVYPINISLLRETSSDMIISLKIIQVPPRSFQHPLPHFLSVSSSHHSTRRFYLLWEGMIHGGRDSSRKTNPVTLSPLRCTQGGSSYRRTRQRERVAPDNRDKMAFLN